MMPLWEVGCFYRRLRAQMRFGKLSRWPLRMVRLQVQNETAELDWMVRPPDAWEEGFPQLVRDRHQSEQALLDAMALREMFFDMLPEVNSAAVRAFRQSAREPPQLIIAGTITREAPSVLRVSSPVMRAKLFGFQFCLYEGVLAPLKEEQATLQLVNSA